MSFLSDIRIIHDAYANQRAFWKVILTTGKEYSENTTRFDLRVAGHRPFDWTLDLIDTSDIMKVKELQLLCPNGQIAQLKITEPGTAFQFKTANLDWYGGGQRTLECQVIGKVINKEEGACECFIWDKIMGLVKYNSSIYKFGSWRAGIAPIGALSHSVTGLRL